MSDAIVVCRLYIVGQAPNSRRAVQNLTKFCNSCLPGRHEIEVIDVFETPGRALADHILLTPTLVIVAPNRQVIIGDLSDGTVLRRALSLEIGIPHESVSAP